MATRVDNIKKNHHRLRLFHVELVLNENNQDIFKNTRLHSAVVIEKVLPDTIRVKHMVISATTAVNSL